MKRLRDYGVMNSKWDNAVTTPHISIFLTGQPAEVTAAYLKKKNFNLHNKTKETKFFSQPKAQGISRKVG